MKSIFVFVIQRVIITITCLIIIIINIIVMIWLKIGIIIAIILTDYSCNLNTFNPEAQLTNTMRVSIVLEIYSRHICVLKL